MDYNKDYYKILEINRDADKQTIKKAYRKLAMEYHPDVNNDADAEEKFKELTEAYAVLYDDDKRKQYDLYGYKAVSTFTQEDLIQSVNLDNVFKGVKFIAGLERDYGLFTGLVGMRLGKRKTSKAIGYASNILLGKSVLSGVISHRRKRKNRNTTGYKKF